MSAETDFAPTGGETRRRKVSFDPTINLGHLLTAAAMLLSGFAAFSTLDRRVTVVEVELRASKEATAQSLGDIKDSLRRVERSADDSGRAR